MNIEGTTVLITGASSGIGRATAVALARRGARLVLAARDRGRLAETLAEVGIAGGEGFVLVADLTASGAPSWVIAQAERAAGAPLDAAVLAAGVTCFAPHDRVTDDELERLLRVNVFAPLSMSRALVGSFRERGRGNLLLVGSVFGALGYPCFAAYSASKAAIRVFAESLRRECAGSGVVISLVAPRATRTPMSESQGRLAEVTGMNLDSPEQVADRIVRALQRDEREATLGLPERIFTKLNAFLPRVIDRALGKEGRRIRPLAEERLASESSLEKEPRDDRVDVHTS